ncbi:ubiquitin-conjugating enzyme family protein [Cryptosporidium andersoni]|uniref:Ubiquitin-conjugating enzyme family protein n=1 Tax=Cryptosporidium andersoni TaxID=117008 RepID=A0A1J4MUL2_9CRYT|nr:ubiquitin-conjugating enzyme family protein [Cryptosporidium andersoni]
MSLNLCIEPSLLRLKKEFEQLDLPDYCILRIGDEKYIELSGQIECYDFDLIGDLLSKYRCFSVYITPQEGYWKNRCIEFNFKIPLGYPHIAPKVKCLTKLFHPNIDENGNICLNCLREDWKPILSITIIICGLLNLLIEPSTTDPLNKEAADIININPILFQETNNKLFNI